MARPQLTVFPHLLAPQAAVEAAPWLRRFPNNTSEPIASHIANWDPGTPLAFSRMVRVDVGTVRDRCRLAPGDRLTVTGQWFSKRTSLRGTSNPAVIDAADNEVDISLEVPAGVIRELLVLRTIVHLGQPSGERPDRFSAAAPGAILWQDRTDVAVEGKGARFPVEVWKFEGMFPSGAGWMLDWRPSSPDSLFMGSVRLLLNQNHRTVVEAATAPAPDITQKHIRSAIYTDVARSLITGMLHNEEFVAGASFDKGTVGQVVGDLIASTFPGEDLGIVKRQLETEPAIFAARIQARFRQFMVA